jgi:serine phosphatase RsbU (regulator of sigma subunit)
MAFGEQLQSVENPADRMKLLCSLMVRREFRGQAAVVLRIRRDKPDEPPRTLCPPQWGPEVKDQSLYISRTLVTALREQARPLVASNVTGQDADVELSNAHAVLAAIACPVRGVEQEIDVLYLLLPPAFGTDEWLALATLAAEHFRQAEQIWASRRQARVNALIEHDLERAREIQMRLVPQEPKVPNLEVAISFQPCRWVGGDYADIVPLSNGRTLLLIADVCGKGLPAALISSSVHTMVRVCVRAGMPLVQVANLLNEHLREYLPANRFVTGVIIELDPATGKIDFINAGHPPPLIVQPGAEPRRMEVTSHPPFGLKDVNYESRGDQLEPGQWLAMYTDGLTEMRDDSGRMLAIERLGDHVRTLVTQTPTATARDLAQRLGDVLDRYQGNRMPADDRTFLLARRT